MYEGTVRNNNTVTGYPNWGAIWAGVFTFFAIWTVFGLLGMSIFGTATTPTASGVGVGMGVWAVILTIIAMYVAGRFTGHLAGVGNSQDGLAHGMIMFGLAVISMLVMTVLAHPGITAESGAAGANTPYLFGLFHNLGWFGFLSLFFGWIGALAGATTGAHILHRPASELPHTA